MFPLTQNTRYLLPLLVFSLVAACIEVDIAVPSFPDMANYFQTTEEKIQWTLGLNFLGFCFSGIFYGPLSESYGRRKVLLFGNALFALGALGCAGATSIEMMLTCRFLQGLGASSCCIVTFTMITDVYQGERAATFIGIMNSILTIIMAGAPIAGGFINEFFGWRANYTSVAFTVLVSSILLLLFLPETLKKPTPFSVKKIVKDYKQLFTHPRFLMAATAPNMICAAYMSFVSAAPFLYIDSENIPVVQFALHQATIVGGFSISSYYSGRILQRFGLRDTACYSSLLVGISCVGLLLLGVYYPHAPIANTFMMFSMAIGAGVAYNVVFTDSLEICPEIRGAASSAIMSMRTLICAIAIGAAGAVYNQSLLPIAFLVASTSVIGTIITWILYSKTRFLAIS